MRTGLPGFRLLKPPVNNSPFGNNQPNQQTKWSEIKNWIDSQGKQENTVMFRLLRNFLLNGLTNLWNKYDWKEELEQFKKDLLLFGIGIDEVS